MAFNPLELLKIKKRLDLFNTAHPRVLPFMQAVEGDLRPGAVMELKVTSPEGLERVTNIRLNEDDVETFQMFKKLREMER
jgi:hypothetical protein